MGTRGTVHWNEVCTWNDSQTGEVKTKKSNLLNVYNHWDSYPEGLGKELAQFISEHTIVNGIGLDDDKTKIANGFSDLALLWLCHHKNGEVGAVYATTEDCELEEYNYWITDDYDARREENWCPEPKHVITIKCINWTEELVFDGTPEEWIKWLKEQEKEQ